MSAATMRSPQFPAVIKQEIAQTEMPSALERAKAALAECWSLDVAKGIADEAKAIARYAAEKKGAEDLLRMARQIQVRAFRRIGQLLKDFKGKLPGAPLAIENVSLRIAAMSEQEFERALAEDRGSSPHLFVQTYSPRPPAQYKGNFRMHRCDAQIYSANGAINSFLAFARTTNAGEIAQRFVLEPSYYRSLRSRVQEIVEWLDEFEQHLPKGKTP